MNTAQSSLPASTLPHLGRRIAGLAALSGLILLSLQSQAQGMGGPGGAGMMGGPEGMEHRPGQRPMDPSMMEKFMERRIDFMVKEAGGTPEQRERLLVIAKAAQADLKPLREQHMQARRKALELLAAPAIDRAALEKLRVSEIQSADAISKRMLQSLVDSAEVFKPEQRAKLAEGMKKRMEHRQHH